MGAVTNAAIAKWQEEAGIEPARGERAEMLERVTELAAEIITLTALESSGIRDGDGYWHGSDPLDEYIRDIYELWSKNAPTRDSFGQTPWCRCAPLVDPADTDIPF